LNLMKRMNILKWIFLFFYYIYNKIIKFIK
jgi:hypothetical protein